ncbi:hypothetical protein P280DRAFT_114255 [Massarina eburnea CBS 473.64]|uniref:Uncharacterized protein n=1 Tax=Massarina eburnea CBS 473.64 TaxID=1395130 RepID=A0A6A6RSQ1_9PLEO|nr:hypothetical protein P280DRAFT_114255 [Massarina eburnea CBS 473.64]
MSCAIHLGHHSFLDCRAGGRGEFAQLTPLLLKCRSHQAWIRESHFPTPFLLLITACLCEGRFPHHRTPLSAFFLIPRALWYGTATLAAKASAVVS